MMAATPLVFASTLLRCRAFLSPAPKSELNKPSLAPDREQYSQRCISSLISGGVGGMRAFVRDGGEGDREMVPPNLQPVSLVCSLCGLVSPPSPDRRHAFAALSLLPSLHPSLTQGCAALAMGTDGLFIEVDEDPSIAPCDGKLQVMMPKP